MLSILYPELFPMSYICASALLLSPGHPLTGSPSMEHSSQIHRDIVIYTMIKPLMIMNSNEVSLTFHNVPSPRVEMRKYTSGCSNK